MASDIPALLKLLTIILWSSDRRLCKLMNQDVSNGFNLDNFDVILMSAGPIPFFD